MIEFKYGFSKTLERTSFDDALEQVTAALKAEGFGVLSQIDVQATLKDKLDVEFRRYVILGACNPPLAHQALDAEPDIGLLLPCNVVIQEGPEDGVIVSMADPKAMFTLVDNQALEPIAKQVESRLKRAMGRLGQQP